ncbi:MAG TPA: hypothetical protein VGF99_08830 [Myxococcota bacterium]
MRPRQHRKALTRFAIGVSAAALVPASMLATVGASAAPVAVACASVAALLGVSALTTTPRRRVTRRPPTTAPAI